MAKVLDGNYDNKPNRKKSNYNSFPQRNYDMDELERKLLGREG